MKILALEFSSSERSAAVLDPQTGRVFESKAQGGQGTAAFHLIETALAQASLDRKAIDCIAVGLGPGSYAGIRIAIAIAQGWQLARETRLLGISSVEALALDAQIAKIYGNVTIAIDAQRGEFYLATYSIGPGMHSLSPTGGEDQGEGASGNHARRKQITPLQLASAADAKVKADSGDIMVGPEATKWFPNGRILFPSARSIATLAKDQKDFRSGDRMEPIYLRETSFVKAPPPRTIT